MFRVVFCHEDGSVLSGIDFPLVLQTKQSIAERIAKTGSQSKLPDAFSRNRFSISGKHQKIFGKILKRFMMTTN